MIWIGTSGYTYKHWKKIFYPEDLSPSKWFEFYASRFQTVELNVSFYRLPSRAAYEGWRRRSPKGFYFIVKGSRYITHIKRLKDCGPALRKFFASALALKEKFGGVLWQLPPQSKKDAARLASFLKALGHFPAVRHVFEFRHESWFDAEITELLKKAGAIFCRADQREFYERVQIPDTADFIYLRRHGNPGHDYGYTETELRRDAAEVRRWAKRGKTVFVYFNNDGKGFALQNAKRLEALLSGLFQPKFRGAPIK